MTVSEVVLERNGEARDHDGRRIGFHDAEADKKTLRTLCRFAGEVSRERVMPASEAERAAGDVRALALPGGDIGQNDASTSPTVATSFVGKLVPIADIVCPVTLIPKTSGTWLGEDVTSDLAKPVLPVRAGTGAPQNINPKLVKATLDVTSDLSLAVDLPSEIVVNSDIDLVKLCIRRLINAHKLRRELSVATLLTTSGNWDTLSTTAVSPKWNGTSPTILADFFAAIAKSLVAPTHFVISEAIAQFFFSDASVYQYRAAGGPMPEIVVAQMRKLVSGAASYIWGITSGANAMFVYASSDPSAVSTARTFRYIGSAPDEQAAAEEANGYLLRSFIDERQGSRGGKSLVAVANEQDIILSNRLGGILTGVLA